MNTRADCLRPSQLNMGKQPVFDEMPAALESDVTLEVDTKWGPNWGNME